MEGNYCVLDKADKKNMSFSLLCFIQILAFTSVIKTELEESVAFQWTYEALSPGCYYTWFLCGAATPLPFP